LSKAHEKHDNHNSFCLQAVLVYPPAISFISLQFTLEVCTATQNRQKITKALYFLGLKVIQGYWC